MVNKKVALTGNEAVALSMKQINHDVVAHIRLPLKRKSYSFFPRLLQMGRWIRNLLPLRVSIVL